jgi:hypothetical protein
MAVACPICGNHILERVLKEINLLSREQNARIGGVCAYRCVGGGHIFFLRVADVNELPRAKAANGAA